MRKPESEIIHLRWLARILLGVATILAVASNPGCRPGQSISVRRYTVRGEVVMLHNPVTRGKEILVHHESIVDFEDSRGKVGMPEMTMSFPIAAGSVAGGLAVGDKVAIRFLADGDGNILRVEGLDKLPPGTPLEYGVNQRQETTRGDGSTVPESEAVQR